ncbi:hypothetical protein AB0383_30070 [Amycolatopsis sp. NPDC051373]|uniref:hypothetical protein n=1 Tax=Amycolatopsis sp. NPDC051373 TaxID=3155801 RepID=UPI00344FA1A4
MPYPQFAMLDPAQMRTQVEPVVRFVGPVGVPRQLAETYGRLLRRQERHQNLRHERIVGDVGTDLDQPLRLFDVRQLGLSRDRLGDRVADLPASLLVVFFRERQKITDPIQLVLCLGGGFESGATTRSAGAVLVRGQFDPEGPLPVSTVLQLGASCPTLPPRFVSARASPVRAS